MPHILPSTVPSISASATFFLSWLNPTPHPIAVYASHPPSPTTAQHSLPGSALPPYRGRSFTGRNASASPDAPELKVRIHSPPAESQVRTCLSREFAFLGREAAVFRGCPGRDERPGSVETRGRGNIWPKGGDISVGPYSSTAPPVMRSASRRRTRHRCNLETGRP